MKESLKDLRLIIYRVKEINPYLGFLLEHWQKDNLVEVTCFKATSLNAIPMIKDLERYQKYVRHDMAVQLGLDLTEKVGEWSTRDEPDHDSQVTRLKVTVLK